MHLLDKRQFATEKRINSRNMIQRTWSRIIYAVTRITLLFQICLFLELLFIKMEEMFSTSLCEAEFARVGLKFWIGNFRIKILDFS